MISAVGEDVKNAAIGPGMGGRGLGGSVFFLKSPNIRLNSRLRYVKDAE